MSTTRSVLEADLRGAEVRNDLLLENLREAEAQRGRYRGRCENLARQVGGPTLRCLVEGLWLEIQGALDSQMRKASGGPSGQQAGVGSPFQTISIPNLRRLEHRLREALDCGGER